MTGDSDDAEYSSDIHGYVQYRIEDSGLDIEKQPAQVSELIEQAASDYIVMTDPGVIEDYEYHYITAVRIATMISDSEGVFHERANDILASFADAPVDEDTAKEVAERAGRYIVGNHVTLVYSMVYEFVNDMMKCLLPKILSDGIDCGAGDVLVSQVGSYPGRADLLSKAGIINKDTRESIRHVREVRRALVHDVRQRFTLSVLENLNEINQLPKLVSELYELVYDMPAYRYIDE